MKKLLLLPFVAALLFSSCSSKFGIAKRKYTKGYYFSVAKNNASDKNETSKTAVTTKNKKPVETIQTVQVAPALVLNTPSEIAVAKQSTSIQNPSGSASTVKRESQSVNAIKLTASTSQSMFDAKSSVKPLLDLKKAKHQITSEKIAASDDRTILLVILAILLPPLAVYLHQDAINTKFWISVILTLLFWIPGVIYALLLVLGVI